MPNYRNSVECIDQLVAAECAQTQMATEEVKAGGLMCLYWTKTCLHAHSDILHLCTTALREHLDKAGITAELISKTRCSIWKALHEEKVWPQQHGMAESRLLSHLTPLACL